MADQRVYVRQGTNGKPIRTIIPSEHPEWQTAAPPSLFLAGDHLWTLLTPIDAAVVRLQVRHYGWDYLTEFRCSIGSGSGSWIPLARFTFSLYELINYGDVDISLFPSSIATALFAGLAQHFASAALNEDLACAPIEYSGSLPVFYPLPGDFTATILPAHLGAAATAG
jgi:hypothetical protein